MIRNREGKRKAINAGKIVRNLEKLPIILFVHMGVRAFLILIHGFEPSVGAFSRQLSCRANVSRVSGIIRLSQSRWSEVSPSKIHTGSRKMSLKLDMVQVLMGFQELFSVHDA